jgi:hypothetical protein
MEDDEMDPAQQALWEAHEKEAERAGAEFWNFGWGETEGSIASKTSRGVLTTTLWGTEYRHDWEEAK